MAPWRDHEEVEVQRVDRTKDPWQALEEELILFPSASTAICSMGWKR